MPVGSGDESLSESGDAERWNVVVTCIVVKIPAANYRERKEEVSRSTRPPTTSEAFSLRARTVHGDVRSSCEASLFREAVEVCVYPEYGTVI